MKEYLNRDIKPLVNPPILNGETKDHSEKACKECGVPLADSDFETCFDCFRENYRRDKI